MQRHRHNEIAIRDVRSTCSREPSCEYGNPFEPIGVLESEDRPLARLVIPHYRARGIEIGRIRMACAAARALEHGRLERQTATRAAGTINEGNLAPAAGA